MAETIKQHIRKPFFLLLAIFTSLMIICSIVNCVLTFTVSNLFTTIAIVALIPVCIGMWYMYFSNRNNNLSSGTLNLMRKGLPIVFLGEVVSDIGLVILIVSNHSTWFQGLRPNYTANSVVIESSKMELFTNVETTVGDTVTEGFESALNLAPIIVTVLMAVLCICLTYVYMKSIDATLISVQNVLNGETENVKVNSFVLFMASIMVIWGALSIFMYNEFMGVFGAITGIVSVVFYILIAVSFMQIAPASNEIIERDSDDTNDHIIEQDIAIEQNS